jgi:hypothetical protein
MERFDVVRRLTLLSTVAVSIVALGPVAAHAQSEWGRQVASLLNDGARIMSIGGYDRRDTFTGELHNRTYTTLSVTLRAGVTYALVGVCDNDCSDLDFRLFDSEGREVVYDTDADDTPLVTVTPSRTQAYQLRVIMASCSAEPCSFGVGLYASQ